MRITIFRHGESIGNTKPLIIQGRSNHLKLSEKGISQAERLGKSLFENKGKLPSKIISSPALRAIQTAEIVSSLLGRTNQNLFLEERIQELTHGDWDGRIRDEVYSQELWKEFQDGNFCAPAGESLGMGADRMYNWLEDTFQEYKNEENIWIFGHGLATRLLVQKIVGYGFSSFSGMKNTGKTIISQDVRGNYIVPIYNDDFLTLV